MKRDPSLYSMQIDVPHSVYGNFGGIIHPELSGWLQARGLRFRLSHQSSSGDGMTNGATNCRSHYIVNNIEESDGLVFQIMFPKCKVHISKQYEYARELL